MEIMATVSSKHQVTIPADVRRRLGIGAADKVVFIIEGDSVRLKPAKKTKFSDFFGSIPALSNESVDLDREIDEAMEERAEEIMQGLLPR